MTTMTKQELENCYDIMLKGNAHLVNLAKIVNMQHRKFRARFFKEKFNPVNWTELNKEQVEVFVQAIPFIEAVRQIEWKMLCAFSRLAKKHASTWAKRTNGEFDDFMQEATLGLLDAIYGYTNKEVKFITFAWCTIRNQVTKFANSNYIFSGLANNTIKLLRRFEEVKNSLNRYATDEEIYDLCNFNDKELHIIRSARVKMYNVSEQDFDEDNFFGDYTEFRRGIINERNTVPCNYEIKEAIRNANLTLAERRVLTTYLFPYSGWKTDLSKTLINPKNGKHYTKQFINYILKKALSKVKHVYLQESA